MKVLVTGGAGFIGSHLAAALAQEGADVRVLDDLSTGRTENLAGVPARITVGDVADPDTVAAATEGCELIFHLAALVSVPRSLAEPIANHRTNVTGAFTVLETARSLGARRVIYASSAAVYGNSPGLPKRESDPTMPITPYAAAKTMNETYARAYAAAYGLQTIGLRFMNVFGPRQDPGSPYSGVLSLFCRAALEGSTCTVYGDGEQTRDFVFVADVVSALLLAARAPLPPGVPSIVLNIGRGEQTSLNRIIELLSDLTGRKVLVKYVAERPGDIRHSVADISQALAALGFQPAVTVNDGLRRTLDWFDGRRGRITKM